MSHPRVGVVSDWANSPVDFCSEQPAAAGPAGAHEVGGGHCNIYALKLSDKLYRLLDKRMHITVIIDERHHLAVMSEDLLDAPRRT